MIQCRDTFLMIKQLVIITSLCGLVACANTDEGQAGESHGAESAGSDCISQAAIRDYTVLNEENLLVTAGGDRKYHVALSRRAFGIRSSSAIGFHSATSRICGGFDEVVVGNGLGPEKIRISSIRRLSPESEEELLIRFGKIEPKYEQPRQPETVQGAEVEELD